MENSKMDISENKGYILPSEVHKLPDSPGVYLMKDKNALIIYVGKAKSLKKRVSSYFQPGRDFDQALKTRFLVDSVAIIDYIKVSNEAEALLLEANLIKEYMPKYNVVFKDNKFYPFIKVTMKEAFPRIVFAREQRKDGSKYFGPYTSAHAVRQYIDIVQRLFLIRTCVEMPKKECLNYHIKRCSGPCIHKISAEDYKKNVNEALMLLGGKTRELKTGLEKQMKEAASKLLFEKAQIIKEKLEAIHLFEDSQSVYLAKDISADFIGCFSKMGRVIFVATIIRGGKMVGKRSYTASLQVEEEIPDIFDLFLREYIKNVETPGDWIIIDKAYESIIPSVNLYFESSQLSVRAGIPRNEKERALIRMAAENASLHMSQVISKVDTSESLRLLQEILELDTLPMRIEGFDIANILGENSVSSLVSFYGGKPDKGNYRHFKIKSKFTPDDFAMIHEAVSRRYKRLRDEDKEYPDLVVIDGGRGQLNAALTALADLGIHLNVVSLAKKNEEIYTPYLEKPIVLPKNSPALHILQQVRDETHRFANTFYNQLKGNSMLSSILDDIPGIGEKRKKIIMQKYIRYDIIKSLRAEDLESDGIPPEAAQKVLEALNDLVKKSSAAE